MRSDVDLDAIAFVPAAPLDRSFSTFSTTVDGITDFEFMLMLFHPTFRDSSPIASQTDVQVSRRLIVLIS